MSKKVAIEEFTFERQRMFSFSDAVFSIAITLLILDISLPDIYNGSSESTWFLLRSLVPNFIGFIVSFFVIALYWKFYLLYSRFIESYTSKLFWFNILLLFFIVLLPFSTSFFVGGFYDDVRFMFYVFNLIMLSIVNYLLLVSVLKTTATKVSTLTRKWLKFRAANTVAVWVLALICIFILPEFARFVFILLFVFQAIGKRFLLRKFRKKSNLKAIK